MIKTSTKNNPAAQKSHHIRTFFAALCGLLALVLIFASILVVWLNQTLTNTQLFTQTLAPLASQADVQNFIAAKATDALITNAPPKDLAATLLPAGALKGQSAGQLQAQLRPVVNQNILQAVWAPQFAALWKNTVSSAHAQFLAQVNSGSPTVTLNLRPAVTGVIGLLQTTNLRIAGDKLAPQDGSDNIVIKGDILAKIRRYYRLFQEGTLGIVTLTLIAAAVCVLLSVHHMRTLRRIVLGMGIIALCIALVLNVPPSRLAVSSSDPLQAKAAVAIAHTLLHNLQIASLILGVACIAVATGSKVFSKLHARA